MKIGNCRVLRSTKITNFDEIFNNPQKSKFYILESYMRKKNDSHALKPIIFKNGYQSYLSTNIGMNLTLLLAEIAKIFGRAAKSQTNFFFWNTTKISLDAILIWPQFSHIEKKGTCRCLDFEEFEKNYIRKKNDRSELTLLLQIPAKQKKLLKMYCFTAFQWKCSK